MLSIGGGVRHGRHLRDHATVLEGSSAPVSAYGGGYLGEQRLGMIGVPCA